MTFGMISAFPSSGIEAFKQGLVFEDRKRLRSEAASRDQEAKKKRKIYLWSLKKRNLTLNRDCQKHIKQPPVFPSSTHVPARGDEAVDGARPWFMGNRNVHPTGGLFLYYRSSPQFNVLCNLRSQSEGSKFQRDEGIGPNGAKQAM